MSWKDAKADAEQWIKDAGITGDLRSRMLILPVFISDADCEFFVPGRPAAFHRMMVQAASRSARKAGAKVVPYTLKPKDYRAWLAAEGKVDAPEVRAQYVLASTRVA